MNCPKCGYAMNEFDAECPRCKRLPAQSPAAAPPPAPLPVAEPVPVPAPPPGKAQGKAEGKAVPVVALAPRSTTLTWVLVAVGIVVILLLAALLWAQLRKPGEAARLAEEAAASRAAAQSRNQSLAAGAQTNQLAANSNAAGLAAGQGQNANALTSNSPNLAGAQGQNANAMTSNAGGVASGQQQNVPPATSDAAGVAAGEDEAPWDANQVASWAKVYDKMGSGQFTTPALPVHRPWSIEYYSGVRPNNDLALDTFAVFAGTGPMQTPVISVSQPGYHDTQPCFKRGPDPIEIVSMFNNWRIIVYQGTFKPGAG